MQDAEVAFLTTLINVVEAEINWVYTHQSSLKYRDTVTVHDMSW